MWRSVLRGLLVASLVGALVAVFATDLPGRVDLDELRGHVRDAGWLGAAAFVVALAFLQPVGVSVYLFMISSSLVWPAPLAIGLSWLGIMGAGVLSFAFSRFVAYDWAHRHIGARLETYDRRLATQGFRTVLITRLLFFTTQPVQLMYGVSSVRFRDFVAGSAIGVLPATVLGVLLGSRIADWLAANPVRTWDVSVPLAAGAAVATVGVIYLVVRFQRRKRRVP